MKVKQDQTWNILPAIISPFFKCKTQIKYCCRESSRTLHSVHANVHIYQIQWDIFPWVIPLMQSKTCSVTAVRHQDMWQEVTILELEQQRCLTSPLNSQISHFTEFQYNGTPIRVPFPPQLPLLQLFFQQFIFSMCDT